uniref:Uncharacterized protein n=1 Tax=Anopheles quadriannulatus TaxID=34691 RepID=A0A182XS13_ANOQN
AEPFRLEQLHQCHVPVGVPRHGQQQIVRQRYIANDSLHSVRYGEMGHDALPSLNGGRCGKTQNRFNAQLFF